MKTWNTERIWSLELLFCKATVFNRCVPWLCNECNVCTRWIRNPLSSGWNVLLITTNANLWTGITSFLWRPTQWTANLDKRHCADPCCGCCVYRHVDCHIVPLETTNRCVDPSSSCHFSLNQGVDWQKEWQMDRCCHWSSSLAKTLVILSILIVWCLVRFWNVYITQSSLSGFQSTPKMTDRHQAWGCTSLI